MVMKRLLYIVLALGLMLSLGITYAFAVPTVSIAPPNSVVQPNQSFTLDIDVTDVTDLYAWQFALAFNPAILAATSITEGPFLQTGGATFFIPGTIDNTLGTIDLTANTLLTAVAGVDGGGAIATVHFQALTSLGTSPITLSNVLLLDSGLDDITADTANGFVTVRQVTTAIPEPGTWLFLATGTAGLLAFWRRRPHTT